MRIRLSNPLTSLEVSLATRAKTKLCSSISFSFLSTDSRELRPGDLFITLSGKVTNGEHFIDEAIKAGAYIISSSNYYKVHFKVDDTALALLKLAEYYKQKLCKLMYTIAITGSIGKTTTKELAYHILRNCYKVHKTPDNQNNEVGVPLTVLSSPSDAEVLLIECGMNHAGELSRLSRAIHPDIAVITNVGTAHIGNLGSREGIAMAKMEITDGMTGGIVLCDADEPLISTCINRMPISVNSYTQAPYRFFTRVGPDGNTYVDYYSPEVTIKSIKCRRLAPNVVSTLAMAMTIGARLGLDKNSLINSIMSIPENAFRHKLISLNSLTILDDSYNASLESIRGALTMLKSYPAPLHSALIGDVLELGEKSEAIHRQIGNTLAEYNLSHLYLYGRNAEVVAQGAIDSHFNSENIFINPSLTAPEVTASQIIENHTLGELILFKASHAINLKKIIDLIKESLK